MNVREILDRVWCAAVDAVTSTNLRNDRGELDEAAFERYRDNVLAEAAGQLAAPAGETLDLVFRYVDLRALVGGYDSACVAGDWTFARELLARIEAAHAAPATVATYAGRVGVAEKLEPGPRELPTVFGEGRNHRYGYDLTKMYDRTDCGLGVVMDPTAGGSPGHCFVYAPATGPVDCPGCLAALPLDQG